MVSVVGPMPLFIDCPSGHRLKVPTKRAGHRIRCPVCDQGVDVPDQTQSGPSARAGESEKHVGFGGPDTGKRLDAPDPTVAEAATLATQSAVSGSLVAEPGPLSKQTDDIASGSPDSEKAEGSIPDEAAGPLPNDSKSGGINTLGASTPAIASPSPDGEEIDELASSAASSKGEDSPGLPETQAGSQPVEQQVDEPPQFDQGQRETEPTSDWSRLTQDVEPANQGGIDLGFELEGIEAAGPSARFPTRSGDFAKDTGRHRLRFGDRRHHRSGVLCIALRHRACRRLAGKVDPRRRCLVVPGVVDFSNSGGGCNLCDSASTLEFRLGDELDRDWARGFLCVCFWHSRCLLRATTRCYVTWDCWTKLIKTRLKHGVSWWFASV